MTGWIKLEKDLRTDPHVLRVALQLCHAGALQSNAAPLPSVTWVLGALAQLWMLADTYICEGDILPFGIDDINQVIGVQGFCEILPPDWLQIIDAHNVKLPGYQQHNGPTAKRRALAQVRQNKHRAKPNGNALALPSVTDALPDLDKTQTQNKEKETPLRGAKKKACRLPADWQPTAADIIFAENLKLDARALAPAFCDYWHAKAGADACKLDWSATWRNWCRRDAGQAARGRGAGQTDVPGAWADIKTHAAAMGFREPWPQESLGAYTTQVKLHESNGAKSVLARLHERRAP